MGEDKVRETTFLLLTPTMLFLLLTGTVAELEATLFLGVAFTIGGEVVGLEGGLLLLAAVGLLMIGVVTPGGDLRPPPDLDDDDEPVGETLPEEGGDFAAAFLAVGVGFDFIAGDEVVDLFGTAGGEFGGKVLGGGGGGGLSDSGGGDVGVGGGEVGVPPPDLDLLASNCDLRAWKFLPDNVLVAGSLPPLGLDGLFWFSNMEILSLMAFLTTGEAEFILAAIFQVEGSFKGGCRISLHRGAAAAETLQLHVKIELF